MERFEKESVSREYQATAKAYAGKWVTMAQEGDHFKLAFNKPGTWSQKHNLLWHKLLGYNLFQNPVRESEVKLYLTKRSQDGLPLESHATYTNPDSEPCPATLTSP